MHLQLPARLLTIPALAVLLLATPAPAAPIQQFDFELGLDQWTTVPEAGDLKLASGADAAKSGEFSLQWNYTPVAGEIAGLVRGELTPFGARSVRLWLRCSVGTTFLLQLAEQDGSRYGTAVYTPPGQWQHVALNLSDFNLLDDSTDENNRLDVDEINSLALIDAAGFLAKLSRQVPFFDQPLPPRILWVDAVAFDGAPVAPLFAERAGTHGREVLLGDFERAIVGWLLIGTGTLSLEQDPANVGQGKSSLRLDYDVAPRRACAVLCGLPRRLAAGAYGVRLKVRCTQDDVLIIGTEERDGSQYNMALQVQGSPDWREEEALFADFKLDENSEDENGKLDPDQMKHVAIVEATAAIQGKAQQGTLLLDEVVLLKP